SGLGEMSTYAVQQVMSALPPIATAKADSRKRSCPLYPQERTCAVHYAMSALGQKRTSASIDYFIRTQQECFCNLQPERLGGGRIDDKVELGWLLDRQV